MSPHKEFILNDPGQNPFWSTVEKKVFQDIIDTLVTDCVNPTKDVTGHKHNKVYQSDGDASAITVDASGIVTLDAYNSATSTSNSYKGLYVDESGVVTKADSGFTSTDKSGRVYGKITTSYLEGEITTTVDYTKNSDVVTISISCSPGTSNSTELQMAPETTWPSEICHTGTSGYNYVYPVILTNNGKVVLGAVQVPKETSENFVFYNSTTSGSLSTTGFDSSGLKGFNKTSITYKIVTSGEG